VIGPTGAMARWQRWLRVAWRDTRVLLRQFRVA
jgi:hypothetical protein